MAGRISKSPNALGLNDLFYASFVTTALDGLPALAVVNPDGSEISGSGGGGSTQYTQGGTAVTNPTGNSLIYFNGSNVPTAVTSTQGLPVSIINESGGVEGNVNLNEVGGAAYGLGQTTSSASLPVTIASNNTGPVELWDGTNTASILAPGTANSTGNAALTAATSMSVTFSYTAPTTGTTYDVGNYSSVSVQITTQYVTSTVTFQTSNDGTNWYSTGLAATTVAMGSVTSASGSVGVIYYGPLTGRYFRINVSGTYTSGTCAGVIVFSTQQKPLNSIGVTTNTTGSAVAGTITTSSSSLINPSISGVGGFALVSIHGTYSGVSFGITLSDDAGTTYYSVPIYDVAANTWLAPGSTITPGTNASKYYWVPLSPTNTVVKVLASAYTSGTANTRISYSAAGMPGSTMAQLMDAAGNNRGANITAGNALQAAPGPTATSVITSVAGANTSTQLLATNTARSGAYFYNDSTAILYLAFATSASTTAYTVQIGAQSFFEMPTNPVYTGAIFGIWASAAGSVRITELS